MAGGTDNNQLKAAAEETAAEAMAVAATETAMATEIVVVTAMKTTPTPPKGYQ
jgi:hypothetical protein